MYSQCFLSILLEILRSSLLGFPICILFDIKICLIFFFFFSLMLIVQLHIFMCATSLFMQNDILFKNVFLHLRVCLHFTVYVPHSFLLYVQDSFVFYASSYTSQFPTARSKPYCSVALVNITTVHI